ncbi:hypothetical protein L0128_22965, partial [candidate division KSB1 bacterium]|nr:hypothetical protein [candidate division KSB1 bacterium]
MRSRMLILFSLSVSWMLATAGEIGHGNAIYRARNDHDGNKIRITFHNSGMMGSKSIGDNVGVYTGEWPKGTGRVQMGNTSMYVMSELRIFTGIDAQGDSNFTYATPVVFCEGWDPNMFSHDSMGTFLGFEPVPGYLSIANKEKDPRHAVAMSHQPFTWPPFWPDKSEDALDAGWRNHWNGYFGKDQMNADQESYFVQDDYTFKKRFVGLALPRPVATEPNRGGLGLRLSARGLQWSNPDAEDCIFWLYEIRNFGELYLSKTLFGNNVGASSGALLTNNSDWDDDVARFYREKALAVNYDYDNKGTGGYSPVPWVGFAFLESPGNPYDGIDNDGDGINPNTPGGGTGILISRADFMKVYAVGSPIVLIDYLSGRFERTVTTMPAQGIQFILNGNRYFMAPNRPLMEIPRNGVDDNLNGLIDESDGAITQDSTEYFLYLRDPIYNNRDYLAKDYINGNGLNNFMIDERRDDGIDNDADWDPSFGDVGLDGKPGTGDTGEGDGIPTPGYGDLPGEPNVDQVDVNESDQIGLTSFKFYQYGELTYSNDVQMWEMSRPGFFDLGSRERADYDYVFTSGYFPLMPGQEEFFSMAMLYGLDEADIIRNKEIVQNIYDANYNFAVAPQIPKLRVVPGDKKVTLYWDENSESSFDRYLYEFDFEGYKLYRATHYTFEDAGEISDGLGYARFLKPIAIFDRVDSVFGFFPVSFGTGVQFNLGNESGLVHTYVDSPLTNGITYYYALTAYDRGALASNIGPSETTIFINVDQAGNLIFGENVVAVKPQAPALGYVPPGFDELPGPVGEVMTNGRVGVRFLEADSLIDGDEYEIQFLDQATDRTDNDFDGLVDTTDLDEMLPIKTTAFILQNRTRAEKIDTVWLYQSRKIKDQIQVITNLYDDTDGDPRTFTKVLRGMELFVYNPAGSFLNLPDKNIIRGIQWSQKVDRENSYNLDFNVFNREKHVPGTAYPRQYAIVFYNEQVQKSTWLYLLKNDGTKTSVPAREMNFKVFDIKTGAELPFGVTDSRLQNTITIDNQKIEVPRRSFTAGDQIILFEQLPHDSIMITYTLINQSLSDSAFYANHGRFLGAGDTLRLFPDYPFTSEIKFNFKVRGQKIDAAYARENLNRIKAVPNPYAVTALWEGHNPYSNGR